VYAEWIVAQPPSQPVGIENPWTGKEHFAQLPKKLFSCQLEQFVFTVFVLVTFLTSSEEMRLVSSENLFNFEPV